MSETSVTGWTTTLIGAIIAAVVAGVILKNVQKEELPHALGGNEREPLYVKVVSDHQVEKDGAGPGKETAPSVVKPEKVNVHQSAPSAVGPQYEVKKQKPVFLFSHDEGSRYVVPYIEERIKELGVPIENVLGKDAFKLATIELRSEVRNVTVDGDSIVRMYITLAAKGSDGVFISQERYELVGTSTMDQDAAMRIASTKFQPIAERLELSKALRNLVGEYAKTGSIL